MKSNSMSKQKLITIEDRDEFISLLNQAKISDDLKVKLIQERWDYLYEKYRPERLKEKGAWKRNQ